MPEKSTPAKPISHTPNRFRRAENFFNECVNPLTIDAAALIVVGDYQGGGFSTTVLKRQDTILAVPGKLFPPTIGVAFVRHHPAVLPQDGAPHQVQKYKQHHLKLSQVASAAKAGISERSARRIEHR